jgi:hypothetical protein
VADAEGRAALAALGARSVPVVSRGNDFVFAQVIADVVDFLGLDDDTAPELAPADLIARLDHVLNAAIRITRAMPDDRLENELPNRPRSWRVLMHHVFQIPTAFFDMDETGETLSHENLVAPPPDDMRTSADIAAFGEAVRTRFIAWRRHAMDRDFNAPVPTYFGKTSRHEMLERTVWHTAQHVRQVADLVARAGAEPPGGPVTVDVSGLPLTETIWDEAP